MMSIPRRRRQMSQIGETLLITPLISAVPVDSSQNLVYLSRGKAGSKAGKNSSSTNDPTISPQARSSLVNQSGSSVEPRFSALISPPHFGTSPTKHAAAAPIRTRAMRQPYLSRPRTPKANAPARGQNPITPKPNTVLSHE
ncbi:hypothetical protein BJX63DRAFT_54871 [Aspergillus granulosus]|uniref:Uncharacterized protein n=1 Tax=Aspergillus granulosus TaxID=176169 RepID=A0ABR4GXT0_9EURO